MTDAFTQVFVQAQDTVGVWRTYTITANDPILMLTSMRSLKTRFPDYRVRAIDTNGRLIDIL
jgi:hypothetical protein